MGAQRCLALVALSALVIATAGKTFLEERFTDDYEKRWQQSSWKKDEGSSADWELTAGDWYGDADADKGIKTPTDARFYTLWTELEEEFVNKGKDLVLQFSVKHTQDLDCGGAYIKLLPASSKDHMPNFSGDTPYSLMFGPDICGYSTKKVHAIITDKKGNNQQLKATVVPKTDQLTHVYTYVLHPNNTYQVLIDNVQERNGSLYEDYDFLAPKMIKDPNESKPDDWVDAAQIPDPEDTKPEDWVDEKSIVDPEAVQPEDWDAEEDGAWEPPTIPNPAYKGEWAPRLIDNPDYKGEWEHPMIENPEYEDDREVHLLPPLKYAGFEIWQVKAGTIFDNILLTDDLAYAHEFAEATWGASRDAEKAMFDAAKAEEERARKEAAEKAAEEAKAAKAAAGDDDDEDDDDAEVVETAKKEAAAAEDEEDQDPEELHAEL